MIRLLFSFLLCIDLAPAAPANAALAITFQANDTHFFELNEWAERNHLLEKQSSNNKIEVMIVGCAGTPECYFFQQRNGRMHVYDPRLKTDWTKTLRKGASLEQLRSMRCFASGLTKGRCQVWEISKTRTELIASAPAMARSLGMFVRSPAKVDIVRQRRFRN